jgi:hypothetical protein
MTETRSTQGSQLDSAHRNFNPVDINIKIRFNIFYPRFDVFIYK